MKTYIIQIVGAAILSVFADMLSPAGWKKHMSIITGIILLTIIVTPLANLRGIDIFYDLNGAKTVSEQGTELYGDMLKSAFSKSVAIDVRDRIRNEFSVETVVEAEVETDGNGNIKKILTIRISGKNLKKEIADRISYIYDVDEVILNDG